tara:strand:- start:9597 stop:9725 length:129 start_codon:yes stop_codon:yes gene_type:complete
MRQSMAHARMVFTIGLAMIITAAMMIHGRLRLVMLSVTIGCV